VGGVGAGVPRLQEACRLVQDAVQGSALSRKTLQELDHCKM
jgi:hypothetical protein